MFAWLSTLGALPNLHPAIIHFPVALLVTATGLDAVRLIAGRPNWLGRSAAALFVLGTLGAGAAYLSGRAAADGLVAVPPEVQPLIGAHSDWALRTLIAFTLISVLRLLVAWRDRRPVAAARGRLRALVLLLAIAGLGILVQTADRGGSLVFEHGLAVATAKPAAPASMASAGAAPPPPATAVAAPAPATTTAGPPSSRLARAAGGGLEWTPLPGDAAALRTVLTRAAGTPEDAVAALPTEAGGSGPGLRLEIDGRTLLTLPGEFDDVQVEARLDLSAFDGRAGVAHHVRDAATAGLFTVSTAGEARLERLRPAGDQLLDSGTGEPPAGVVTLAVSAAGRHLKGLRDGQTVAHGHVAAAAPGAAGLYLDGRGVVRVLSMRVIPLQPHH